MGPGLVAWIALLSGHFRLSTRSIQSFMEMQWGLRFSTGAISESQAPVAEWLKPLHDHIGDTVRRAPVAHADETTHFKEKKRLWLWVLCTQQLAFFNVHASRAQKAAEALIGSFTGILVTDPSWRLQKLSGGAAATLLGACHQESGAYFRTQRGSGRFWLMDGTFCPHHHPAGTPLEEKWLQIRTLPTALAGCTCQFQGISGKRCG